MTDPSPSLTELHAKLDHLAVSLAVPQRRAWVDYFCAVLLSCATIASAWSAYQSARWSGVQTFRLAAMNKVSRDAAAREAKALSLRSFDAQMFSDFVAAKFRGEEKFAEFLRNRFRPDARGAIDAWLSRNPQTNPDAPPHPFVLPEYREPDRQQAEALNAEAGRMLDWAADANHTSDRYTLLTVLFATVLFFGGISGSMQSPFLRRLLMILGAVLFLGTLVILIDLPYCRE